MNFESDCIENYDKLVAALDRYECRSKPKKLDLDMKNCDYHPAKSFIEEAQKPELKDIPSHLSYELLVKFETPSTIIVEDLSGQQVEYLVLVVKRFKNAIR